MAKEIGAGSFVPVDGEQVDFENSQACKRVSKAERDRLSELAIRIIRGEPEACETDLNG